MFPSEATCVNDKRKILTQKDVDDLLEELKGMNLMERILTKHNDVRTPMDDAMINSKVSIVSILNLYCSIFLMEHGIPQ